MLAILLFYLVVFTIGFTLCVMPGPVAIEVFHHALKKQNKHALSIGIGAGVGDGIWAMVAFFGITPFLKNDQGNTLEGIFLLVAAVVTFIIGTLAIKNSKIKYAHKHQGVKTMAFVTQDKVALFIMPDGVEDRAAEVWEALLAVADAAGGDWPKLARVACVHLIDAAKDRRVSLGIRLLQDLRTIYTNAATDKLSTAYLLDSLASSHSGLDDDAPWGDLYGNPINARKLASLLKPYGISSKKLRINDLTQQGYHKEDLYDVWQRYLPPAASAQMEHMEQIPQLRDDGGFGDSNVPHVPDVPDSRHMRSVE